MLTILSLHALSGVAQEQVKPLGFSMVPRKAALGNGVTVLVNEDRTSGLIAGLITFAVGVREEGEGAAGMRHLLAHVMYGRALECKPAAAGRSIEFDDQTGAMVAYDLISFGFKVSSTLVDDALARNAQALSNERITEPALARARQIVLREIDEMAVADGRSLANPHAILAAAYRESEPRLSSSLLGDASKIGNFSVRELRSFAERHFIATKCSVTFAGDVNFETAVQLAQRYYGFLPSSPPSLGPLAGSRFGSGREVAAETIAPLKDATAWTRIDQLGSGEREWLAIAYRSDTTDPSDWAASLILGELLRRKLTARFSSEPPERDLTIAVDVTATLLDASSRLAFLRIVASELPGRSYTVWQLEDQIHEVLAAYLKQGVPAYEADSAARRVQFTLDRALEDLSLRAWLFTASTVRTGSEFSLARLADRLAKLQADDVLDAARAIVAEPRLVTITLSKPPADSRR